MLIAYILSLFVVSEVLADEKIVGGREVKPGEMPYMIYIADFTNGGSGSGALVTPWRVTTAAHVLQVKFSTETGKLFGGVVKVKNAEDPHMQSRKIQSVVFHPKAKMSKDPPTEMHIYDVACAVADSPFTLTTTVKVLEFPSKEPAAFRQAWEVVQKEKKRCLGAGWGFQKDADGKLISSMDLKVITVLLLNERECLRFAGKEWYNNGVRCAISKERETSICMGDFGGPLVCDGLGYAIVIGNMSGVPVFPGYDPTICNGVGVWYGYRLYEDLFEILSLNDSSKSQYPPNLFFLTLSLAIIRFLLILQQT